MKTFNCALAGAFMFFAGTNLWAVPAGFNIQGRLTDANGINKDGTFQIKFSVFAADAGGSPIWEKNMPSVPVKNGNFQVILQGAGDNSVQLETAVRDLEATYVEIKVGNEPPLVPRQPLLRSPFSSPDKVSGKSDILIQSDSQSVGAGSIFLKTGNNNRLTILNNGNVGIGTAGPGAKLDIGGSGNMRIGFDYAGTNSILKTFTTGHAAGNVPSQLNIGLDDGAFTGMLIKDVRDGATYNSQSIEFATHHGGVTSGTRMTIDKDGNVGIGTMSTFTDQRGQTAKLNVAGSINSESRGHTVMMTDTPGYLEYYIDGNYWGVSIWASSKRFKTNITKLELDSDMIYDLRPVSFNWIAKRGGKRDFGLIAEEVEKVLPLLINYDSEGKAFGVKYDLLSVLLLNEVKQKNAEIGILKGEIEQFKARLAKLEQSVLGK